MISSIIDNLRHFYTLCMVHKIFLNSLQGLYEEAFKRMPNNTVLMHFRGRLYFEIAQFTDEDKSAMVQYNVAIPTITINHAIFDFREVTLLILICICILVRKQLKQIIVFVVHFTKKSFDYKLFTQLLWNFFFFI